MNLSRIDMNLLVVFEALMEERNVTRAGDRVGLAQPSVSSALGRLRRLFDDDLFVRTPSGMAPTRRALEIAPRVGEALHLIRAAFDPGRPLEPAGVQDRIVTLAVTDYADLILVPPLVAALRRRAPGLTLRVRPLAPTRLVSEIDAGEVDFGIGAHLDAPARLSVRPLFEERFVCVTDPGNPVAASGLTLAAYTALPHALFSASAEGSGVVDEALGRIGLARRVAVILPHVVAVPFAVRGSDLVATLAERIALRFAEAAGVTIHPLPTLDLGTFSVNIASGWRVEDPLR